MAVKIYGSNRIDLDGNNETFSIRATADDELNFYKGANTKLMGIDASGFESKPNLPGFHVSNTTNPVTNTFTGTDNTLLHFDYVNRNDGNWNTTSKRYTVPVSGHYFMYCQTRYDGTTTYNRLYISINGMSGFWQPGIHNITNDATISYISLSVSGHLYLNVGDYIEARGGSNNASGSHQGEGSFGAYLIG